MLGDENRAWVWMVASVLVVGVWAGPPVMAGCSDCDVGNAGCGCPCTASDCTVGCQTVNGCKACCGEWFGGSKRCKLNCIYQGSGPGGTLPDIPALPISPDTLP